MTGNIRAFLFIIIFFFHTKLIAGGLDGIGMRDDFITGLFWFSLSIVVFFIARKQFRKNQDHSSLQLMLVSLISLIGFFIYGIVGMYLGHGSRVVPGMMGFRADISSMSFIVRCILVIITIAITYQIYNKNKRGK
ncbi:MAG: hypothetical protein GQ574_14330 [Crocinitomix sp.]|nr:hypothetical protein [Crocinitomix sp.]